MSQRYLQSGGQPVSEYDWRDRLSWLWPRYAERRRVRRLEAQLAYFDPVKKARMVARTRELEKLETT